MTTCNCMGGPNCCMFRAYRPPLFANDFRTQPNPGSVDGLVARLVRECDELRAALHEAHQTLVDITCVGITIDKGDYPTQEAKMRNLACQGIGAANRALDATRPLESGGRRDG